MEINSLPDVLVRCGQMGFPQNHIAWEHKVCIHGGLLAAIGMEVTAKRKKGPLWHRLQPLNSMIAQLFPSP
jgi:hypothetical protein